jgi:hypothetical protein
LGVRAARANGKILSRPKRVFRRDEVLRLRDEQGLSGVSRAQRAASFYGVSLDGADALDLVLNAEKIVGGS